MKAKRPFKVYVCRTFVLTPCDAYRAERGRGCYGFHPHGCPDCKREHEGFELWGENGHRQGGVRGDRAELVSLLKYRVRSEYFGSLASRLTRPVYACGRDITYLA